MLKIDQVKNLFDCDQCNQLLVDPIALPCGNSVCKKHVDEERAPKRIKLEEASPKESNFFLCELCKENHFIPDNGFAINKRIQNALDIKLNSLKLNPVYDLYNRLRVPRIIVSSCPKNQRG